VAHRTPGRFLERRGLLERDAETRSLVLDEMADHAVRAGEAGGAGDATGLPFQPV